MLRQVIVLTLLEAVSLADFKLVWFAAGGMRIMRRSIDEDLGLVLLLRAELIVSFQSEQEEKWACIKRCIDFSIQANRMHDLGDHGA